ncbi:MAG: hypothetical protein ACUVXI_01405 [bacterium]
MWDRDDTELKLRVRDFWNEKPCGTLSVKAPEGSNEEIRDFR